MSSAKTTELDLIGLKCPLPVLKTQKALASMTAGDRLSVTTSDPMAAIDLPHFCNEKGHLLLDMIQLTGDQMRFEIQKG